MGKLYLCVNCEEEHINDKQRHHYEKHLEIPYKAKFFKAVCDYRNITKIRCLLCGYIIESDQYNRKMKKHAQVIHPRKKHLTDIFDSAKALRCIAIKCSFCKRFVEKERLTKIPKCPHGSLFADPSGLLAKTENGRSGEIRKRNTRNDISEREIKITKESCGTEATSTTVEREPPDEATTKCNICHDNVKTSALETHMRRKHLEKSIVLDSDSEQELENPTIKVEKDAEHSNVVTLNSHNEPSKIKVEKDAEHSNVATLNSHNELSKIKFEKDAEHFNTLITSPPIPKEVPSNESNERLNQEPSHSETEFYPLRISKSELETFLLAKRIYPKNGHFYLKDS